METTKKEHLKSSCRVAQMLTLRTLRKPFQLLMRKYGASSEGWKETQKKNKRKAINEKSPQVELF